MTWTTLAILYVLAIAMLAGISYFFGNSKAGKAARHGLNALLLMIPWGVEKFRGK